MAKRSLLREDFRGSDRTLVSSSLDSKNSSRSNVNTLVSSSYFSNSNMDVRDSDRTDDEDDDDEDDEEEDEENEDDGRPKPEMLEQDRGLWEKRIHYILLGFGTVFGVRNILDFPALAMEHGGGAFLFVFVVLTFTVGLPIVYLEVSIGQYARGGVVKTWRILPLARGIAVCSLLLTLTRCAYSNTPAVWALYYLYSAIANSLPRLNSSSTDTLDPGGQGSNLTIDLATSLSAFLHKSSYNTSYNFLFYSTLEITDSISIMGHVVPHMIFCLIIVWALVFSLAALGPRLMGKVSFLFTAIPSVLLAIMFIAACTLSGSVLGIQTFLNPRWHHLSSFKPWLDGLDLVLSSLTSGTGVLITLSGHCNFHGNTFRNAISLTLLSLMMTIVSGCLMFSLLGVEQTLSGIHVDNMTRITDMELGFVLFPTVTSNLPTPNFWSGIFCITIVLFSILQAATMVHHFQQGVVDMVHLEEIRLHWKMAILGSVVVIMMAFNIFTTAQNGLYVLCLLQLSVPRLTAPLICAAQCVTVGWGYGARRFAGRVTEMTGRNKSFVWKWLWRWGCPVLLSLYSVASLLTTNLLQDLPQRDMEKKWLHGIGWAINPVILFPGIAMAAVSFFRVRGNFKQRLKQLRSTPSTWGPGHPEHEPQADLPDYVICHPDPFRPANALAMLTANLYLPNIVNFVNMQNSAPENEMPPGFLSDVATLTSSEDEASIDAPSSKDSFLGRFHATVACLSHVIGLGNIVRFPYLAYRHGGGAFLIAYTVVLVTCGIPLVIIETAIGQFSSLGPIQVWRAVPIFKGVGWSMVMISVVTSVYYSIVTSWSVFYLATSLTSVTPWQGCTNDYNTNSCRPHDLTMKICNVLNETSMDNVTFVSPNACEDSDDANCVRQTPSNTSCSQVVVPNNESGNGNGTVSPSDEYFYLSVVKVSGSWSEVGELRWQLLLCLMLTWTIVILFLAKGLKPGGKTTYIMLTLTCTILVIFLVRTSALVGGHDGLNHLFTPQWSRLIHAHVWRDAASQVFFSLSLGSGTLVAMGTYNKFKNNLLREAVLLCVIDSAVSLLCSLVIFAVIGALAYDAGLGIDVAARADLGLTFVALSFASLQLPWPLFWAILAFLMLVMLGVCTSVACISTAVTSLMDVFSTALKKQRVWLLLSLCSASAVLGLPLIVRVGFYVVDLLDTHLSGLPQLCVGGAVVVAFAWVYGFGRFSGDVQRMTNTGVGWGWKLLWVVVCPSATGMLVFSAVISLTSSSNELQHPKWATTLGFIFWFLLICPAFVGIVHEVWQHKNGSFLDRLRKASQSRKEWGATLHRSNSQVEYYPTVTTHLGIDISSEGLHTVTDHVEFTTVGVRVPSLSQTTLLPVSPGMPRGKKPMDMRHKAILNHAYSNPQCNLSSASLEKLGRRKRNGMSVSSEDLNDVIIVKKTNKHVVTCDVSTQTDLIENKLCRQRSQPTVHVTKPVQLITRSSSWHQLRGQPAILEVNTRQISQSSKQNPSSEDEKPPPRAECSRTMSQRRRRYGQSVAPNLAMLMNDDESPVTESSPVAPVTTCAVIVTNENDETVSNSPLLSPNTSTVTSPDTPNSPMNIVSPNMPKSSMNMESPNAPAMFMNEASPNTPTLSTDMATPSTPTTSMNMSTPSTPTTFLNMVPSKIPRLSIDMASSNSPVLSPSSKAPVPHTSSYPVGHRARMNNAKRILHGRASVSAPLPKGVNLHPRPSLPSAFANSSTAYGRRKSKLKSNGIRSRSVEEAPVSIPRSYDVYGPSQGIDNASFCGRTRSDSDNKGVLRRLSTSSIRSFEHDRFLKKGLNKDLNGARRGSNVIMEEDDFCKMSEEYLNNFDMAYQIIHAETEVSKL